MGRVRPQPREQQRGEGAVNLPSLKEKHWDYTDVFGDSWEASGMGSKSLTEDLKKATEAKRKGGGVEKRKREHVDLTPQEMQKRRREGQDRSRRDRTSKSPVPRSKSDNRSQTRVETPVPPKVSVARQELKKQIAAACGEPQGLPLKVKGSLPRAESGKTSHRPRPTQRNDEEEDNEEDSYGSDDSFLEDDLKDRKRARPKASRRSHEDGSEEEEDFNMDEIRKLFRRPGRSRRNDYDDDDDDDDDEEDTGFEALMREEARSAKLGRMEDDRELRLEQKRKMAKLKKKGIRS
mmetsp:Transcript_16959/g.35188  ORF Transcript_16959/g.35188 Transcript_16959/m.35188 type:complete len:292 (+) Transcript_16959:2-877(+)